MREQVGWAQETIHNAPALLRENFKQLITINSALLGGSATLLQYLKLSPYFVGLGLLCLLVSLGVSLWGSFPCEASICPYMPDAIWRSAGFLSRARTTIWRSRSLSPVRSGWRSFGFPGEQSSRKQCSSPLSPRPEQAPCTGIEPSFPVDSRGDAHQPLHTA
jgi:hypothetical protein